MVPKRKGNALANLAIDHIGDINEMIFDLAQLHLALAKFGTSFLEE